MKKRIKTVKNKIKTSLLLICVFLCNIVFVNAQDREFKKNSIYLNYGTVVFSSQFSISYERTIFQKKHLSTKLKVNYGKYLNNNLDLETDERIYNNYIGISGVFLFKLFEINLGVATTEYTLARGFNADPNKDYDEIKTGAIFYRNAGIRYEKDNFIIRTGIGNLELLYVGIGFNF